jgi:hypothetical protein
MASVFSNLQPASAMQGLQTMPANSSFIAAFEYDQANLTLTTHLKSGAIYQAKFFLPSEWEALKTSQNHSKHWANKVKGKKLSVAVKRVKTPKSGVKNRHYGK